MRETRRRSSSILNICVDCHRPWELAQFWSAVLDKAVHHENEPGDDEVGIPLDADGKELLFLEVPESKTVKNRLHVCLRPDGPRDAEVDRLLALGATMVDDRRKPDRGWAVLADPEGNEFCVLISAAERELLLASM